VRVLLKIAAALCVVIGAFLIYAVIHAAESSGGAKAGVAVLYVVIAIALGYAASRLWRRSSGSKAAAAG
jgi:drug/metabolite transporter superfamily protein YnfA